MCLQCDWKRVFYYEFFSEKQTINLNKYSSKLDQSKVAIENKTSTWNQLSEENNPLG